MPRSGDPPRGGKLNGCSIAGSNPSTSKYSRFTAAAERRRRRTWGRQRPRRAGSTRRARTSEATFAPFGRPDGHGDGLRRPAPGRPGRPRREGRRRRMLVDIMRLIGSSMKRNGVYPLAMTGALLLVGLVGSTLLLASTASASPALSTVASTAVIAELSSPESPGGAPGVSLAVGDRSAQAVELPMLSRTPDAGGPRSVDQAWPRLCAPRAPPDCPHLRS